jgi:hypothetical protein
MTALTPRQQCQTAFQWKPFTKETWGETGVSRIDNANDPNSICPYCKNEQTTPVTDSSVLLSYRDNPAFKGWVFKVFECYCCNAVFSWYKDKENV